MTEAAWHIINDNSIGGWFSSTLSFVSAQLALGTGHLRRRGGDDGATGWFLIGLFFLYLSSDDAAKIHERIGSTFDTLAKSGHLALFERYPSYTWQVTVGPLLVCAAILVMVVLWRHFRGVASRGMLILAFGCLALAVLLDVAEGVEGVHQWVARYTWLRPFSVSHYLRVLEEFLEMLGLAVLLCLFLDFFLRALVQVRFVSD